MNHSINLLEPREIRYLSAAESNPLFKLAAVGVVVVIIALVTLHYFSLQNTIRKGEQLKTRWEDIETKVAEAEKLIEKQQRLEKGLQTLKGWRASKINWNSLMTYLVDQMPGDFENTQFTRLDIDEVMRGLRNQKPGGKAKDFHPLTREVRINLRGVVRSNAPARMLSRFQRNLLNGDAPVDFEEIALDRYTQLRDEKGDITDLTTFSFTITLSPLEVMP